MKSLRAKLYSMKLEEETSKRYNQRKIQVGHSEIQRTVKGKPQVETIKYNIKYRCDALSLKLWHDVEFDWCENIMKTQVRY